MDVPRASGCYPILNEPPPPYGSVYIDPPAYEPPDPSSPTYSAPPSLHLSCPLPPYEPSPQSSTTINRSSEPCPPAYSEHPPPYCITSTFSLQAPTLDLSPVPSVQEDPSLWDELAVEKKTNNCFMAWSIIIFILFPPIGLVSIIYTIKMRNLIREGELEQVDKLCGTLIKLNLIGLIGAFLMAVALYILVPVLCTLGRED
ncbi:hypothetical protein XENTR_v10019717 [Xenopus tropicalis]|uniref:Proline-rich receptor-like protein kinase PERK9 n=1 Tax=Xenopus tropicalis TaxID=8364 RepID=A0A1B8Y1S6_XENTR|nr:proline-rich receptor-like protein kinase PERK9 [Xenopus tropicalis]KAE8594620.1 hypothetical protein XENTR_v10019717 [Xenopus tropicalis]|eukprot:XP_004916473.1 PREDICTED: proline-rich receptor-like protein kinase PERK9 [Xenopus tropicalis]